MITQGQVEEIIFSLAVIIALLAFYTGIDWLGVLFTLKAVFDFGCVIYRDHEQVKEKQKKEEP